MQICTTWKLIPARYLAYHINQCPKIFYREGDKGAFPPLKSFPPELGLNNDLALSQQLYSTVKQNTASSTYIVEDPHFVYFLEESLSVIRFEIKFVICKSNQICNQIQISVLGSCWLTETCDTPIVNMFFEQSSHVLRQKYC